VLCYVIMVRHFLPMPMLSHVLSYGIPCYTTLSWYGTSCLCHGSHTCYGTAYHFFHSAVHLTYVIALTHVMVGPTAYHFILSWYSTCQCHRSDAHYGTASHLIRIRHILPMPSLARTIWYSISLYQGMAHPAYAIAHTHFIVGLQLNQIKNYKLSICRESKIRLLV